MPETDIVRVTAPIRVEPDEDGFLIEITSGKRTFQFHASRHKVAGVNQMVAAMLRKLERDGCEVRALRQASPRSN